MAKIDNQWALQVARWALRDLLELDHKVELFCEDALYMALKGMLDSSDMDRLHRCKASELEVDILIPVGGDGTILWTLQRCPDAPILAVNAGTVGFLTEVEPEEMKDAFAKVLEGRYNILERQRLKTVARDRRLYDSLNETVIHTERVSHMRTFQIWVDSEMVIELRADGIIVSTPTGSTCYALSAGSPIIDPRIPAVAIVAIAPFKVNARPMIVPSDRHIRIHINDDKGNALVILDGQHEHSIPPRSDVHIMASETPARFIRLQGSFYRRIREKILS